MNLYTINNIVSGDLYSAIRKRQKDNSRYDIPFWEPQNFDRFPGVSVTYFDKDYITNVIGRNQLARLDTQTILTIVAQTGSGKTTWLFKTLAPWILEQKPNKKILYLCNRISLADQIKQIAMKDEVNGQLYAGDCCVKEKKDYFSAKGLQAEYDFGLYHIMTYQSYLTKYKKLNLNDYEFVVYDEGHWFLNESSYNPYTEEILLLLNEKHFRNTKKIILTATPQYSLDVIWNSIYNSNQDPFNRPRMQIFYAKEDYSYVHAKFFAEMESIINEIEFRDKGYWLMFVKSKKIGKDLERILFNKGIECSFITADTDKGNEDYRNLITDEKLPKKVLVSTRVLEVGINVKNSSMNIVVMDLELPSMKQMIGRKRIKENETVNVYFYTPSIQELSKRSNSIKQKLADINKKLHAIKSNEFIEQLEPPFYYHGAEVKINSLCLHKLKLESNYYDRLISYLKPYDDYLEQAKAYAAYLLEEFDGINYLEEDLLVTNPLEKLNDLLTQYEGQEMLKEEFEDFSGKLVDIIGDPRDRNRKQNPAINSIKPTLKKYGYTINSDGQPRKYTIVKKEGE